MGAKISEMDSSGSNTRANRGLFEEICNHHGWAITAMEVAKNHIHIMLSFQPRYSISRVVEILKSVSAKEIRKEYPQIKRELWGGEFWEDGYFARTVGDKVTEQVTKKYIQFHKESKEQGEQLELF